MCARAQERLSWALWRECEEVGYYVTEGLSGALDIRRQVVRDAVAAHANTMNTAEVCASRALCTFERQLGIFECTICWCIADLPVPRSLACVPSPPPSPPH